MYYFRIAVGSGEWQDFKLTEDEVRKLKTATRCERIKEIQKAKDDAVKLGVQAPTEAEILFTASGSAPSYGELAVDYIRKQLSLKKAAVQAAAEKESAAA